MENKFFLWLLLYYIYLPSMDLPQSRLSAKSSLRIQRTQDSSRIEFSPRQENNKLPTLACLTARCLAHKYALSQDEALNLITPKDQECVREIVTRELIKPHIFPLLIYESQNKKSVHHNGVCGLDFISNTQEVVSGACDGKIVFCSKNSLAAGVSYQFDQLHVSALTVCPDQSHKIFIGSQGGYVYQMNYETKKIERYFKAHEGTINRICVGNTLLASSSIDKTVKLWNAETATCEGCFSHKESVRCIELIEDSQDLISGSSDGSLKLWDFHSKELIIQYAYPTNYKIWGMALLRNAKKIITGLNTRSGEGRVSMIDAEQFKEMFQWYAHGQTISALSSDSDEKYFATASWDCKARLWDIRMRACAATFEGHASWVQQIKCVGNEVVTGSRDNTLKLWDIRAIKAIDAQALPHVIAFAAGLKNKASLKEPKERASLLNEFITKKS